jgi:hypothetical protein
VTVLISALAAAVMLAGCSAPLPWPESPLYEFPDPGLAPRPPQTVQEAMKAIVGHYAHYDVVAYEDVSTRTPMRTFTVSYGFTDFAIESGKLLQIDRFCRAEQKLNQKNVRVMFSDKATRAIEPRVQEVELRMENDRWVVIRPRSPTLLGITGDPSLTRTATAIPA